MDVFSKLSSKTLCLGQDLASVISDSISDEEEKESGNVDETLIEMVKNAETRNLKALLISTN